MVLLCGTGTAFGQMTLDTFHALKSCARIVCVGLDSETLGRARAAFPEAEVCLAAGEEGSIAEAVLLAAADGGRVGVLFSGHPLLYGAGTAVAARCRAAGQDCRVLPAVSSLDGVLGEAEAALAGDERRLLERGVAVLSAPDLLREAMPCDPKVTTAVLNLHRLQEQSGAGAWARLQGHLLRFYDPVRPVLLVEAAGDARPARLQRATLERLGELGSAVDERATLLLPASLEEAVESDALPL